ncbi:MAG: tRNA (adenosine(37)-N6)-threonylcarbamoyltransferase complex dimerization subunit type 1 TsaB, partial [Sciscionella sp.]
MLVLAIDTATPAVTAGVVELTDVPRTRAVRVSLDSRAHTELLTPHVLACLAEAGLGFAELDAIVVGVGPGPFTGLRVGIVTAAAYGQATGAPVYPVCTLDAIATAVTGAVLVATDARRREVYWARYDDRGIRVDGPHVRAPAALAGMDVPCAAGAGARRYSEVLGLPQA